MATYEVDRIQITDALSEDGTIERFVTKFAMVDGIKTALRATIPIKSKKFSELSPELQELILAELITLGEDDLPQE